ncbi:hypothetical protein CO172_01880 [Candidatus Uhrbacteria bacterium CG_4_9_14_3_um_filter_36_7]|uniref:Metallo-beta-lactamase domain-containing protein n=1 Tax=Candidatus Uhrbacteria bacterium CG_4_9_14_3_um_filter_36_7 TaxID=1975033 RepID=A0A2M7XI21_9BACT|nr:MAG: hypothetical protein CO172_01880 [Candidatus Uhrbacteria bacterium CG_4_9_14_3_um_filter_36_7]
MSAKHLIRARPLYTSVRTKSIKSFLFFFGVFLFAFFLQQKEISSYFLPWTSKDFIIWIFDVGQADAIFLQTPEGKQILLDAGGDSQILSKIGQVLPIWDRTIDVFISTHPDADHLTGAISVLESYKVKTIFESGAKSNEPVQESFYKIIREQNIPTHYLLGGDTFWFDGIKFEVLAPDRAVYGKYLKDTNEASVVLLVTYGETSILFTGDLPIEAESQILSDINMPVDILKVPHHGSRFATSPMLLDRICPNTAIISVGTNSYGHPHPVVLERLQNKGVKIFRTDQDGDILIKSDATNLVIYASPLFF